MKEHSAAIPQTGRGVRAKWDLLEHLAGTITKHLSMFFQDVDAIGFRLKMSKFRKQIVLDSFGTNLRQVLRYMETQEAKKAQKTAAGFKAMDWVQYSKYFMILGLCFVLLGDRKLFCFP